MRLYIFSLDKNANRSNRKEKKSVTNEVFNIAARQSTLKQVTISKKNEIYLTTVKKGKRDILYVSRRFDSCGIILRQTKNTY